MCVTKENSLEFLNEGDKELCIDDKLFFSAKNERGSEGETDNGIVISRKG